MTTRIAKLGAVVSLAALVWVAAVSPASAAKPRIDYDTEYDFSGKTSFGWSNESIPAPSELLQKRIESAVVDTLETKGIAPAVEGTVPDFVVLLESYTDTRVKSGSSVGIGIGRGFGWGGISVGGSKAVGGKPVQIGTLLIQIIDRESGALVWEAEMSDKISGEAEQVDKKIRRAVEKAFKKFPPKQKKKK